MQASNTEECFEIRSNEKKLEAALQKRSHFQSKVTSLGWNSKFQAYGAGSEKRIQELGRIGEDEFPKVEIAIPFFIKPV